MISVAQRWLLRTLPAWTLMTDANAQLVETFNDASLHVPVVWRDTSGWLQQGGYLRSNEAQEQHSFSIFTLAPLTNASATLEWQAGIRLAFNPSSANYLDWFLMADSIPGVARNGYYVRIGNTRDEISLYKLQNGLAREIISGQDGRLNRSENAWMIRVRCRDRRYWQLEVMEAGAPMWEREGFCEDLAEKLSSYQGFRVRQSTTSFHKQHFIDDVYAGPARFDTVPPLLQEAVFLNDGSLRLRFSEPLSALTDPGSEHFWLEGAGGPDEVFTASDDAVRYLRWKTWKPEVSTFLLRAGGISDTAGNRADDLEFSFFGGIPDIPRQGQLLITEIMAAPESGQPEWVELQNVHTRWLTLEACSFSDAGSTVLLPDTWLAPGQRCVLQPFGWTKTIGSGKTLRLSLPALNNAGDTLTLRNGSGQLLHRVAYAESWYGNPVLASGGYSLEMMDTSVWCGGPGNWKGCAAPERSTPGLKNSVSATLYDTIAPVLTDVYPESRFALRLTYSEWPDTASFKPDFFIVQPGIISPSSLEPDEGRQVLRLQFSTPFAENQIYRLDTKSASDCSGNAMPPTQRYFGMPVDSVHPGDLLINEVLFDPAAGGVDFVELFNPGPDALDLEGLELLRLDEQGIPLDVGKLTENGKLLLPGGYAVLSDNPDTVQAQYPCNGGDSAFLLVRPMPALPASGGKITLRRRDGTEIDHMAFHPAMHHPLLKLTKGYSLERLRTAVLTSEPTNWHSASQDCRATPGRKNSQAKPAMAAATELQLDAEWFTPDNDGQSDQVALRYCFTTAGLLLTVRVYDAWGMPVRWLSQHRLCGLEGQVAWDGLREDGGPAPAGNYILLAEIQDAAGRQQKNKLLVSLLRSQ